MGGKRRAKIWQDPWIPDFQIVTTPTYSLGLDPLEATVDQLINNLTHEWNIYRIHSQFSPLEVSGIFKVPLSPEHHENK